MFNRPRCRDWTPLGTQQLRLRNLIRILGYNINCDSRSQLYYTLHSTPKTPAFYTSEKLNSHGSKFFDWPEIHSTNVIKSPLKCICIKVWEYVSTIEIGLDRNLNEMQSDKLKFIWGVYFSGLVPIKLNSDVRFHENSLVFQMHGTYFVSTKSLTDKSLHQQIMKNYKNEKLLDNVSNISNSSFKEQGLIEEKLLETKAGSSYQINSPRSSPSCSPVGDNLMCSLKPNHSPDFLNILNVRYLEKSFPKFEIRQSYTIKKLLQIQEIQRKCKQKNDHAKEIIEKICMKSAFCLNVDLITNKGGFYKTKSNPSVGRTLNRLLLNEVQMKPEDILKAQNFRRETESARFRLKLLLEEHDKVKDKLNEIEKKQILLHDNNIEHGSWLMSCYRNLGREKETLVEQHSINTRKKDILFKEKSILQNRQVQLCKQLQEIYLVELKSNGYYAINDIILPNTEEKLFHNECVTESVTPFSLSVALGYIAHAVQKISFILNLPLRNPILYEGSSSRILDIIKNIPNNSREFPLHTRAIPLSQPVLYAIYLLNQNICQLNYQTRGVKCDPRRTLANLLELLNGPYINTVLSKKPEQCSKISILGSSIDLNVSLPSNQSYPGNLNSGEIEKRMCRSVGSYSDENFSSSDKNVFNSEPILTYSKNNEKTYKINN